MLVNRLLKVVVPVIRTDIPRIYGHIEIMAQVTCKLKPVDGPYEVVTLPHQQCVTLGRSPHTRINDKRCSRSQVEVTADMDLKIVKVTHIGSNRAGVNGLALEKKGSINLIHDDRIELVLGSFIYRIEFDPPPIESKQNGKKRQLEDTEEHSAKKHCDDLETLDSDTAVPSTSSSSSVPSCSKSDRNWENLDNGKLFIYKTGNNEGRAKIAAFDMDGTLIITKSGKVFPVNNEDWKLALPEIPSKLKNLWENGYKIVIMTNQAGIGRGKINVTDFKRKIEAVVKKLNVPAQVFISTGKGIYRKPAPGMWNELVERNNDDVPVAMNESFYCGDAAGRPVNWAPKRKKDFSVADRLLALNLNLKFYTPEEYFLKARPAPYDMPAFLPQSLNDTTDLCVPSDANIINNSTEVIVFVGSPGSGKSYFSKTYLIPKGYVHVNRDKLGSWQKCVSTLDEALNRKQSVVVDNTSPDAESRQRFVEVAKKHNVPCRCFIMNTSLAHAKHNNRFRELTDPSHQEIPDMIINAYNKKFEEPSIQEGFTEVVKINCVPKFNNPEHEKLYKMFLLEK